MVKVYFGCSMRGGFSSVSQEDLRKIQELITEMGHQLASEHQTSKTFMQDEAHLTPAQIHDRDYDYLLGAQLGIFEISNPSLGVGGEVSDMIHLGKPVLLLFRKGLEERVSAYIQGKQNSKHITTPVECHAYQSPEDAKSIIAQFIIESYL